MTDPKDSLQPAPQEFEGEQLDQVVGGRNDGVKILATVNQEAAQKAGTTPPKQRG